MKNWFVDTRFRRLFKNAGMLLGGNAGASVLAVASTALTARALGPESFGILVLITTYTLVVDRLVNFQSWQAVIKYGADALRGSDDGAFVGLIRFGFLLDGGTALLGAVVACTAAWYFGHWRGWDGQTVVLASVYGVTILFHVSGTPVAILRLFNRFKLLSLQTVVAAIIRISGVTVAFVVGGGLPAFLLAWALADVIGRLILVVLSLRVLRSEGHPIHISDLPRSCTSRFPGLWSFVLTTNLNSSVRLVSREVDIFFVGALLSPAAVGLLKVAKQVSRVLSRLSDPLYQSIYPELSMMLASGQNRRLVIYSARAALLAGIPALVFWIAAVLLGEYILGIVFGAVFVAAYPVMVWYLLAIVVSIWGFPLQPMMLAYGLPHKSFRIQIAATIAYFGLLYLLTANLEAVGAALAYLGYYIVWTCLMMTNLFRVISRRG